MSHSMQSTPRPPSGGLHIGYVLLACFLFLMGGGVFWYATVRSLTNEKAALARELEAWTNQTVRAQLDRTKAAEDAKFAIARNRQEELLSQARNATNAIEQLRSSVEKLRSKSDELKSNEVGKRIGLHPDLVAQALRIYTKEISALPSSEQINGRLEGARRIEQQVRQNAGTLYEPDAAMAVAAQGAAIWADQIQQSVSQAEAVLTTLVQESQIKVTSVKLTDASLTLGAIMNDFAQAETSGRNRVIVEKTTEAKSIAAETLAAAEAGKILEDAKRQAEKIMSEATEAAERQKREIALRLAEANVEGTKLDVAKVAADNEALRLKLRQKASDAKIQGKLTPFTTPGYVRLPGSIAADKKPHSLNELRVCGCLEPTMTGMQRLVDVAYGRVDKERPRWTFKRHGAKAWQNDSEEKEMVREIQSLLIELGPVLVEMGLLAP